MQIRKATIHDARRISYLIKKNTEKVEENNYSDAQIRAWKQANSPKAITQLLKERTIFCAFQNNKLLGTIGLKGSEVVGVYVSYSKRGQGIGKVLLTYLEEYARSNNIQSLVLTSTISAVKFYKSLGYRAEETVIVNIDGVDFEETSMRKNLFLEK